MDHHFAKGFCVLVFFWWFSGVLSGSDALFQSLARLYAYSNLEFWRQMIIFRTRVATFVGDPKQKQECKEFQISIDQGQSYLFGSQKWTKMKIFLFGLGLGRWMFLLLLHAHKLKKWNFAREKCKKWGALCWVKLLGLLQEEVKGKSCIGTVGALRTHC